MEAVLRSLDYDKILWQQLAGYLVPFAPETKKKYGNYLGEYLRFLGTSLAKKGSAVIFLRATKADFNMFVEDMQDRDGLDGKRATSTCNNVIKIVVRVYKLAIDDGLISKSPAAWFKNNFCTDSVYISEMIPFDRIEDIINFDVHDFGSARNNALLAVMFAGALRPNELVKIKKRDLGMAADYTPYVRLRRTKNGNDYKQPINDSAMPHIRRLSTFNDPSLDSFLFTSIKRPDISHLTEKSVNQIVKQRAAGLNLTNKITAYSFRATAITYLIYAGEPLRKVQLFARHKNINTTLRYERYLHAMLESSSKKLPKF